MHATVAVCIHVRLTFENYFSVRKAFRSFCVKMGRGRRGSNKRGNYRNQGSRNKSNRGSGGYKNKRGFNKVGDGKKDDSSESKRQKLELEKEKQPVIEEESSSSDSEEEVKPYIQLLSMFKSSSKAQQVLTSDEEEQSEEEVEEEQSEDEGNSNSGDEVSDIDEEEMEEEVENSVEEEDEGQEEASDIEEEQSKLELEDAEAESEEEVLEGDEEEEPLTTNDPFSLHYGREMSDNLLEILTSPKPYDTQELKWKALGRMVVHLPKKVENNTDKPKPILGETIETFVIPGTVPVLKTGVSMKDYGVKLQLCANLDKRPLSDSNDTQTAEELLSPLQHELFTLANDYRDIYYPEMNHLNNDEIRTVYCLHSLNHVLKSRDKVLFHNAKLKKASESGAMTGEIEYRDQGLVRPRVLIIAPLRNSAVK